MSGPIRRVLAVGRRQLHVMAACLLALVLRLPAVFNGLPYVEHPDEPVIYDTARRMVANGTALPRVYIYPSLHFDLNAIAIQVVATLGRWFGAWQSIDELGLAPSRPGATYTLNSEPWVAARLVTVAVSVAGVALVVLLAARLTGSRRWGMVAGAFAAFSGIGVAAGSVIAADALAGTMATATVISALRLHGPGAIGADRRWALLTGALLGLTVGSKYNAALVVVVIVASVALAPATRRPTPRHLAMLAFAAAGAFLLSTPGALFDFRHFFEELRSLNSHYSTGHAGFEGDSPLANLRDLWASDAVALLLAAVAVATRRTRAVLVLAGWVLVYFAFVSVPEVHFARNLTPLLGSLAVLAALGGQRVWSTVRTTGPRRALAAAAAVLVLVPPTVLQLRDRGRQWAYDFTDHQGEARRWLTAQLPEGAAVLTDTYTPWLDETRYELTISGLLAQASAERAAEFPTLYDAVVVTSKGSGRFTADAERYPTQAERLRAMRRDACRVVRHEDAMGHWIEVLFQRCD